MLQNFYEREMAGLTREEPIISATPLISEPMRSMEESQR
jgi:hypothetical protein